MNPSAQRIRELFAQNDPTNYYWENFRKFLQGHSHKACAALLTGNEWTPDQSRALLAITAGISPVDWFNTPTEQQAMKLLSRVDIQRTWRLPNASVDPMIAHRLHVLGPCWDEMNSRGKFNAWNSWHSGVKLGKEGETFALNKMKKWNAQSPHDAEMKLQALVGTMDELSENMRNHNLSGLFNEYKGILHQELELLRPQWQVTGIESVQTWRQLQSYPQFLDGVPHPHPWMESMCVAHTGWMAKDLPLPIVFREEAARLDCRKVQREIVSNTSNPLDKPLAEALRRHFMNEDPRPKPEVQGLFALLEGSTGIVGTLMSMTTMANQEQLDVAGDVFELAP